MGAGRAAGRAAPQTLKSCFKVALDAADEQNDAWPGDRTRVSRAQGARTAPVTGDREDQKSYTIQKGPTL